MKGVCSAPASTPPQLGSSLLDLFCPPLPRAPECGLSSTGPSPEWDCDSLPLPPQIRSVIRRSRETGHAHPMSREPSPRRRLDPATLSRTPSQERLIAELQGRLGIQPEAEEAAGAAGASAEDWLTEGVIITVQPRGRRAGGQLVEKVARRCPGLGQGQGSMCPDSSPALAGGEIWCVGGPASCGLVRLALL